MQICLYKVARLKTVLETYSAGPEARVEQWQAPGEQAVGSLRRNRGVRRCEGLLEFLSTMLNQSVPEKLLPLRLLKTAG